MRTTNHNLFTADLLDNVVKEFEKWRTTRDKRGPIPDTLRALIKSLEGKYSPNNIVKALGINHQQLKNCFSLSNQEPLKKPIRLVECLNTTQTAPPLTLKSHGATLIFNCKNGKSVTLNGLYGNDIAIAISSLVKE
jgi:hypothetical protein